jgi:hypothetical protein
LNESEIGKRYLSVATVVPDDEIVDHFGLNIAELPIARYYIWGALVDSKRYHTVGEAVGWILEKENTPMKI